MVLDTPPLASALAAPRPLSPVRRLELFLVRPTKYDDDGYLLRHWLGVLPTNTLACLDAGRRVLDREIPLAAFPGASDAYPFQHIGGIPTIASFGPGWLTPAHGPNEWVSLSSLKEAAEIYAQLAITFCSG